MGYCEPDVYYQPEKFGLKLIKEKDTADSYEFDIVALWKETETGRFYIGHDSGCSCPSPFEDHTSIEDLTEVRTLADVQSYLAGLSYWGDEKDRAEFLSGVEL